MDLNTNHLRHPQSLFGTFLLYRYPASHPFASLKGSDNIIAFTTERFPNPLIIQGAGAGAAVTAFGIYSDILKIAERTQH